MAKAIGIDLGTTNSVGCYFDGEKARVLRNAHHEELTPSVVGCEKFDDEDDGEITVGRPAVNQAKLFPRDTIYSIKRVIGRPFRHDNVQELSKRINYDLIESDAEETKGLVAVRMGGEDYLPQEISAYVLKDIKQYAQTAIGEEVTHAVVTVPAYFGDPEKAATRQAGQLAGLVVKTLLPEPTAAALAFGIENDTSEGKFILVYDLGGGTFDISIISVVDQDYNVMRVNGDQFLGGDDFDDVIVDMILAQVNRDFEMDLSADPKFRIVAKAKAERAKIALSSSEETRILEPDAVNIGGKSINIRLTVTREQFESAIRDRVNDSMTLVKETLRDEGLTPDDITDVLLVGGSTGVPIVYKTLEAIFGKEKVRRDVNPMHCVAIGASIMAHRMKGIECPGCKQTCDESLTKCPNCDEALSVARAVFEDMAVTEITSNHFGIQAVSGSDPYAFNILVEAGTEVPMKESRSETFYTTEENQTLIKVPVYEGMKETVLQNTKIGEIKQQLDDPLAKNEPVRVALSLDRQSLVRYVIEVERLGFRIEGELTRELEDEFVEDLLEDDEDELAEADKFLTILENYVDRGHHFLHQYASILTTAQKNRLGRALEDAQKIIDEERGNDAKETVMTIDRLMLRCGAASLLDQAELAAHQTNEARAGQIRQLAKELLRAAETRNEARVRELQSPLAALIREVHKEHQDVERIGEATQYGGLLRHGRE